ncbi:MAG TPA: MBL fold metallo-hydrolase [Chitinophagaceae bacterium]|nr:MBL fold metallo-hydrolase [Chitinophagaceae bacterium]
MRLFSINAGFFKLDGGAMFGVVPKSMWQKLNTPDENNMCSWAMRCLLIEDGGRLILVDNGMGDKQDKKFFDHYFLHGDDTLEKSLAKNGFSKDDITDVFLTHLHFDHCGGSIEKKDDKLVTAFKNASYWSNEAHWEWAVNANDREKASFLKENILPIKESGQLKFIEVMDGVAFTENIKVRFMNGHTQAMMLPQINYKGKTIVYMADLLPSVAHIPIPYVMAYDTNPLQTLDEKKLFLDEAQQKDYILFFEHDPKIECCNLQLTEKGIRVKDTFSLAEV